jgi:hypothetical protein
MSIKLEYLYRPEIKSDKDPSNINQILQYILGISGLDISEIKGNGKGGSVKEKVSIARQQYVFLCLKYTSAPLSMISSRLSLQPRYVSKLLWRISPKSTIINRVGSAFARDMHLLGPVENWQRRVYGKEYNDIIKE